MKQLYDVAKYLHVSQNKYDNISIIFIRLAYISLVMKKVLVVSKRKVR